MRKQKPRDILDLDEMETDPSLNGALSFMVRTSPPQVPSATSAVAEPTGRSDQSSIGAEIASTSGSKVLDPDEPMVSTNFSHEQQLSTSGQSDYGLQRSEVHSPERLIASPLVDEIRPATGQSDHWSERLELARTSNQNDPVRQPVQTEQVKPRESPALEPVVEATLGRYETIVELTSSRKVLFIGEGKQRRRVFRPTQVQDGLSDGEEKVLNAMSRLARSGQHGRREPDGWLLYTGGQKVLAEHAKKTYKNTKNCLRSLQKKCVIDLAQPHNSRLSEEGRAQWRIAPYTEILRRWREAGMSWVYRTGITGVMFLTDEEVQKAARPLVDMATGRFDFEHDSTTDDSATGRLIDPTPSPVVGSMGLLNKEVKNRNTRRNPATTDPSPLADLILKAVGNAADVGAEFVNRVWQQATKAVPDITPEETAYFVGQLWQTFTRKRTINNPAGVIITSIGGTVRLQLDRYRQQAEQRRVNEDAAREDTIRAWRAIAEDLGETDESREQAKAVLRDIGVEV